MLISVAEKNAGARRRSAQEFAELGFRILATEGTHGVPGGARRAGRARSHKLHEGRPNIADAIMNKQIQLVINTPVGKRSQYDDSYIRKTAIKYKVPYITTLAAALAAARASPPAGRAGRGPVAAELPRRPRIRAAHGAQ